MFKLRPIVALVLGACLLQACVTPPTKQEMAIQPVLRINHSSDQTAATYYQLGKYHQERGHLDLARAAYTQSIALNRRQLEARNALAAIYSQQGRLDDARALLLQLVADFPAVAHPYNNLGYVYYLQGNFDAAVTTLQRALVLDSGNERARNNLEAVQVALASHGERAVDAVGLAPTVNETKSALPDATTANRKEGDAVTANIASPPATQLTTKLAEPAAPSAPIPRPQGLALMNPPSVPQTRMEVVQMAPNVYELKMKAAFAPVIVKRQVEKTVVAAAAPAPAVATAAAAKAFKVEVANGNGITGMARRIRGVLGQYGIAVNRLTNQRPYKHLTTEIQYRVGYKQEAEALKNALRGYAVVVPTNNLSSNSDVRLVLGKDAIAHMALIDGSASSSVLAFNQATN